MDDRCNPKLRLEQDCCRTAAFIIARRCWGAGRAVEAKSSDDPVIAADVRRCLKELNEKYRKCVTLIYLNGLSYEELAAELGEPVGSVKSWVHRAVRELGICLGRR